ncbi:hypothetical protein [Pacificoceanicola onchidii]|uniref:hypothetical protein n=1 Tax=Pacificoceanicola onchidii TaxID=2562685 RepID=UPI0014562784|nr:hypothetical protein [Pacificoceanicola onchidii]
MLSQKTPGAALAFVFTAFAEDTGALNHWQNAEVANARLEAEFGAIDAIEAMLAN